MTLSLASGISRVSVPFDKNQAADLLAELPHELTTNSVGELLYGVAGCSPFLGQLIRLNSSWLVDAIHQPSQTVLRDLINAISDGTDHVDWETLLRNLRIVRGRAALYIALCDLGGLWCLSDVTKGLSFLASNLTDFALDWIISDAIRQKKIPDISPKDVKNRVGLFVIAMGKLGAQELNYSSDIDLICLFDQEKFEPINYAEARSQFIKSIRRLVKALSEWTVDGYVFRTDLRLRPNPSTTPVCMSMQAAQQYYVSVGRTWERAAHIKASPIAGDFEAGLRYLRSLESFIWKDPLDFAAIEDIENILRQIRIKKGHFSVSAVPGCDIKLSPGGIREIELFAQTRQLIMAGRLPVLREKQTINALAALRDEGAISVSMCQALTQTYIGHRTTEHRLQMIGDQQTQTIPVDDKVRACVAALDGWTNTRAWEEAIAERLETVHQVTESFFDASTRIPSQPDVTSGAEILATIDLKNPQAVNQMIQRWREGGISATSSERTQRLYHLLEPEIVKILSKADNPDLAFAEFDKFLSGLSEGLHVFSMFRANQDLLRSIIDIFILAPRLASLLGKWPQTLDAHFEEDFLKKIPSQIWLEADLRIRMGDTENYERILEIVRIWAREIKFRVFVHMLAGKLDAVEAGEAFSAIAEATLTELLPVVIQQFVSKRDTVPCCRLAVIAMGKLGTREMTASSDLDLIVVYDGESDQENAFVLSKHYSNLTRAIIAALTADTSQGSLYSVDMRLRPSGRQGPVAVSLAAFEHHQMEKAWVWEHLALMKGRVVFGEQELVKKIELIMDKVFLKRKGDEQVFHEAAKMRQKLIDTHRPERDDAWAFKHTCGGLMEIEFFAQTIGLLYGVGNGLSCNRLLDQIAEMKQMGPEKLKTLKEAVHIQMTLQHIDCIALERSHSIMDIGEPLRNVMVKSIGAFDFEMLQMTLQSVQKQAALICGDYFGN
ncbi:MAG: bifunctional [glutamine synthetase] adenylyltransferase/[glutamine synthetase]-adenylyl-L-tyrosine phosphorylase [Aestuariivita sp.]|nr:bifunctional [glutamine synthetase] adenylyltransferase/[glutamine synthetase]-adenylyl-L-tyrosine phosphorylase [Aestuariivita sp.]